MTWLRKILLFGCCILTGSTAAAQRVPTGLYGQNKSPVEKRITQSVAFVAMGWKTRSVRFKTIAEELADKIYSDSSLAEGVLRQAQEGRVATLPRETVLRCMVALASGPKIDHLDGLAKEIFERSDQWRKTYSATEYKWRTFAVKSLTRDIRLLPAYERILQASPNDYRAELGYDHLLLFHGRGDLAIPRMRRFSVRYSKHMGTQTFLARLIRDYATERRDKMLFYESTQILERARTLPASDAEKRDLEAEYVRNQAGWRRLFPS